VDGEINILDVLSVVNHILALQLLEENALVRADCNGDELINILDALGIIRVILGLGECVPGVAKPLFTVEVLEFFESLESYFSAEDFSRLMDLVKSIPMVPTDFALNQNHHCVLAQIPGQAMNLYIWLEVSVIIIILGFILLK